MISRTRAAVPILLGVLMIIALACQSSGANPGDATPLAGTVGSGNSTTPTATVEPAEPTLMEMEEPAPIVSVVIEKEAAKPPNSMLVIVSALPDGCHELAGHGLRRDGDTFTVEITNLVKLGFPCTEQYRTACRQRTGASHATRRGRLRPQPPATG